MNGSILVIASFALGAFLSAVYDIFRLARLIREQKGVILFINDFVYSIIAALCMTVLFFNLSYGRMRAFAFAFVIVGFLIWRISVGKIFMLLMSRIIRLIKRILKSIKTRIIAMISAIIGWINRKKGALPARLKRKENENVADQESKA